MKTTFILKPGEIKTYKKSDKTFKISCNSFKDHDHKAKPIYYYHDGMKDEDIVATVEGNDNPPYDSPYSNTVNANWTVFRENITIHFTKKENHLKVEIEELIP